MCGVGPGLPAALPLLCTRSLTLHPGHTRAPAPPAPLAPNALGPEQVVHPTLHATPQPCALRSPLSAATASGRLPGHRRPSLAGRWTVGLFRAFPARWRPRVVIRGIAALRPGPLFRASGQDGSFPPSPAGARESDEPQVSDEPRKAVCGRRLGSAGGLGRWHWAGPQEKPVGPQFSDPRARGRAGSASGPPDTGGEWGGLSRMGSAAQVRRSTAPARLRRPGRGQGLPRRP